MEVFAMTNPDKAAMPYIVKKKTGNQFQPQACAGFPFSGGQCSPAYGFATYICYCIFCYNTSALPSK